VRKRLNGYMNILKLLERNENQSNRKTGTARYWGVFIQANPDKNISYSEVANKLKRYLTNEAEMSYNSTSIKISPEK